jgi:putative transposase
MPNLPSKRLGPPRNSGVRDLVSDLRHSHTRQTAKMGQAGFRGWHERGYLPHYDVPNVTQFVTFGLADALPPNALARILEKADEKAQRRILEFELDRGHGSCWLSRPEIAEMVQAALLHFHGERYELRAWVVMGNHVHALVRVTDIPLAKLIESWKSFTSHKANKLLKRAGKFWADDYFDIHVRGAAHEEQLVRYIEQNPCKAKLARDPKDWLWSSARFRDDYERLCLTNLNRTAPVPGAAAPMKPDA